MGSVAIDTVKAREGMASVVKQVLKHGQVLHGEHVDSGEGGGVRWNAGVDVGSVLHQQGDGPDAALPRCHHQRSEHVQVWVGTSRQQLFHGVNVVIEDREVERCAAAVLVQPRPFVRQLGIDVKASLDQNLQNIIAVTLSSEVQWADTTPPDSGLTGSWDQRGNNTRNRKCDS